MTNEEILALADELRCAYGSPTVRGCKICPPCKAAAALRQLVEERDAIKKRYLDGVSCSGRLTNKGYMPDCQWLREERDREERLLRDGFALTIRRHMFRWRRITEWHEDEWYEHPDRAEAARMAEAKSK